MNTSSSLLPYDLTCEYEGNPLGLDAKKPRLSWKSQSHMGMRGAHQTAYRIVASNREEDLLREENLLWDSGRVESEQSSLVEYAGAELASRQRVFWKVQVWDENGASSALSETAWFETAFFDADEWRATWIGATPGSSAEPENIALWQTVPEAEWEGSWAKMQRRAISQLHPAPHLRRVFNADKVVKKARVYATARGLYELYINGERIGDRVFAPGWTEYSKRIQYQTYDVTSAVRNGENAIGVILGDGWYRGCVAWNLDRNIWGEHAEILLQLHIEYEDGSEEITVSDDSWKAAAGAIEYSDFLMGEKYDARKSLVDWSSPNYDDSDWSGVLTYPHDNSILVAQCGPPVRRLMELPAKSVMENTPGTFIFDLGQNFTGVVRLRVRGNAGDEITMRHAEVLNPDGSLYITNLRAARSIDTYIVRGDDEEEVFEPRFTFHGFRYVEVTGFPGTPTLDAITGIVLGTDTPRSGTFECSHPMINQLQSNIEWGQRGNFLEVPTDCPQRDERLGWLADAQVFSGTAAYNAQIAGFMTKWLRDIRDSQSAEGDFPNVAPRIALMMDTAGAPAWGDAGVIIPWNVYRVYGDERVLAENFDAMKAWVRYLDEANPNGLWLEKRSYDFGDWLSIEADTDKDMLATAYFARSTYIVVEAARVLGRKECEAHFSALYGKIKAAFNAEYVEENGRIRGNTQTAYVLALQYDLIPREMREVALRYLVEDIESKNTHLSTGFVGVVHLLPVLSEAGRDDLAFKLLQNDTFPSWGYSIRHGATTIWERWDGWTHDKGFQTIGMNSFNHYSLGSVGEWLYRYMAGIGLAQDFAGFKKLKMQPHFGEGITSVTATYESPYGTVRSAWNLENGTLTWKMSVPVGSTATAILPARNVTESGVELENASGISAISRNEGNVSMELESGNYVFAATLVVL